MRVCSSCPEIRLLSFAVNWKLPARNRRILHLTRNTTVAFFQPIFGCHLLGNKSVLTFDQNRDDNVRSILSLSLKSCLLMVEKCANFQPKNPVSLNFTLMYTHLLRILAYNDLYLFLWQDTSNHFPSILSAKKDLKLRML